MNLTNDLNQTDCSYDPVELLTERFYLIGIFGSLLCLVGLCNSILLISSLSKVSTTTSHLVYIKWISVTDIIMLIAYISIFSVEVAIDYFETVPLLQFWAQYVIEVFTISRIAQLTSGYLMLMATIERYLSLVYIQRARVLCTQGSAKLVVVFTTLFAVVLRVWTLWEITTVKNPDCPGIQVITLSQSSLMENEFYREIYCFYVLNTLQVVMPFTLLLILNVNIIIHVKRSISNSSIIAICRLSNRAAERRQALRSTTKTLTAVVTVYLVCNTLSLYLTVQEFINMDLLLRHRHFYQLARDLASLLSVLNATLRLLVCCVCNRTIRHSFKSHLEYLPFYNCQRKTQKYSVKRPAGIPVKFTQLNTEC